MKLLSYALLYTLLVPGAIAAAGTGATPDAGPAVDVAMLETLREGDMKKLVFHAEAKPVPDVAYVDADGTEGTLADYRGKHVLLNFWATWCAPCREEMPQLATLQRDFGGDAFAVVTIATGRNPVPAMKKFFGEVGVDNLPLHRDPSQKLAREMAVLGLPMTMLIDPEGREIARLRGGADWNSDSARAIVAALQPPS